jgi:quercetin dioxygenase-like cupin family protein
MKSNFDLLGQWPISGEEARREGRMIRIPPDQFLHFVHGEKNHVLVSFFVSNDLMHEGMMTLPPGGHSDVESHAGDEVIYVLEGVLVMRIHSDGQTSPPITVEGFQVAQGQKFLVPEGARHQYFNLTDRVTRIIFAVAPGL